MTYKISKYSLDNAKSLGVHIKPSGNKRKKFDVYKNDKKIASIGSVGYFDYPTLILEKGKKIADERRKLYKKRHQHDLSVVGSNGYYANKLLWLIN